MTNPTQIRSMFNSLCSSFYLAVMLGCVLCACEKQGHSSVTVLAAIDASKSAFNEQFRGNAVASALTVMDSASPETKFTLWRVCRDVVTAFDNTKPEDITDFSRVLQTYFAAACDDAGGTALPAVLTRIADQADQNKGAVFVFLYTDGVLDDPDRDNALEHAATRLALNPEVNLVWVAGLKTNGGYRDGLLEHLEPLQKAGKLMTANLEEITDTEAKFIERLTNAN